MNKNIELKSISELLGMKFFIPSYQRGYRWTEQQVKDLLEDIKEFMENGTNGIYCIQPLVVKRREEDILEKIKFAETLGEVERLLKGSWEVIDGQQRLTTIKILLSYLGSANYELEYETRKKYEDSSDKIKKHIGSSEFLAGICKDSYSCGEDEVDAEEVSTSNIDFYHMKKAYDTIKNWYEENINDNKVQETFLKTLKEKVQFIWYETTEKNPITVFTRLNIGKIPLTDSELIKALFLNESNFKSENKDSIRLQQIEIANEWDRIEYALQNDEFWLFIQNETEYKKPTRIDFIFDLIREKKVLGDMGDCGKDEHQTFRYFYQYFQTSKKDDAEWLRKTWLVVKNYFQIFEEWYNDLELYHYVGYLIERCEKIDSLIEEFKGDKASFKVSLKNKIKEKIAKCADLSKEYEKGTDKTVCRPILLLHNIQTVINQNKNLKDDKYGMSVFYKFPFHLLKKESWDVEHIDSNTTNPLTNFNEQKEWLKDCQKELSDEELMNYIDAFVNSKGQPENFSELVVQIYSELNKNTDNLREPLNEGDSNEKNLIWNYCLLDSGTNRSYGNAIFPAKRRRIIQKDKGENGVAFVPPCTKNVFLKYYNQQTNVLRVWSKSDAEAYLKDIERTLLEFLYPDLYKTLQEKNIPIHKTALADKMICLISKDLLGRYVKFVGQVLKDKK